MEIDETDRQILRALLADGRASDREIAAETGIVRNRIADRREKLEAEGVITGYTAIVDYDTLGYDVTAVFQLIIEGDGLVSILDSLEGMDDVTAVYEVTGDHDIVAVGKFAGTDDMNSRIKDLLTDPDVRSVSTSVVLNVVGENEPIELPDR